MYQYCPLYALQSKKMLLAILGIKEKCWLKNDFVQQNIHPYINNPKKPRLVEPPSPQLNLIQRKIKNGLIKCQFPEYVYSGVKGKSYVDNAKSHGGINYLYKIDITAFFPNISREKVYCFFHNELKTSPDVAEILTNFCTSDLSRELTNRIEIDDFINKKKIRQMNHLCTGASPSPLLSYLVNQNMFHEMMNLCRKYNVKMTVYVDDAVFSCKKPIEPWFRKQILKIITKYGYNISMKKVKYYLPSEVKKVTGVIIKPDGSLDVPNRLRLKIKKRFKRVQDKSDLDRLSGCIISARQINKAMYPSLSQYIKAQNAKIK